MDKLVSIIVPVYNVEKYIGRCIEAIIEQTYKNIEVILVNDCSADESLSICKSYASKDNRIIVLENKKQSGASASRNAGIEKATGEYIMFVDSDDYPCNNYVEEMVKTIEEKNVDIVRCKAITHNSDGSFHIENLKTHTGQTYYGDEVKKFAKNNLIVFSESYICAYIWAIIVKREKITVRYNPTVYSRNDLVFFVQLLIESDISSIYFLDKPLYNYCYNGNSLTKGYQGCLRYLDGVLVSTKEIKKILSRNNMIDADFEDKINTTNACVIINRLLSLKELPLKDIRNSLKEQCKKNDFKDFLKAVKISTLGIRWKAIIIWLRLHLYYSAAFYIKYIHNKK